MIKEKVQAGMESMLNPASVAIVGISPSENRATLAYRNLIEIGFSGDVYFVNPKYDEVHNKKCYPTIKDIPSEIDTVFISVPGEFVLSILEDSVEKGARSAVVISSGFGEGKESDNVNRTNLETFCSENDFYVCGPNCLGLFNVPDQYSAYGYFSPENLKDGNIGGVFQSGGLMHAIALELCQRGAGVSSFISSGNEISVNSSDYLMYLANDAHTKVILMFMEGIKDPQKFIEAAKVARDNGKVIITIKTGKSAKAKESAIAHTGSMAGNADIISKVFENEGVIEVNSVDELIETSILFSAFKNRSYHFTQSNVAINTVSGGEVGLYSDIGEAVDLTFPNFSKETKEEIEKILPDFGTVNNPLDTTGNAALSKDIYKQTLKTIANDDNINVCVVSQMELTKQALEHVKTSRVIIESLEEVSSEQMTREAKKLFVCITPNVGSADHYVATRLFENNVPLLLGAENSLKALKHLDRYLITCSNNTKKVQEDSFHIKGNLLRGLSGTLSENESQEILRQIGVQIPKKQIVTSKEEAVQVAEAIGFPIVMKIDSKDIPHKSDIGAVKININTEEDVIKSYQTIKEAVQMHHPHAYINGVSVEQMIEGGIESFIGVRNDSMFGPIIGVGLGGVWVELVNDFTFDLAPINVAQAIDLIKQTRLSKLLEGYRGDDAYDIKALAGIISRLSYFVSEHKDKISEVDINPIIVLEEGKGCIAVDGLIVLN